MQCTGARKSCVLHTALALVVLAACLVSGSSGAIELIFDYRYDERGFFDDPARRALIEWAGQQYSDELDGTLGRLGDRGFRARFLNPHNGELISVEDLDIDAQTLLIFVGARPLMGESRIAVGGPGYAQFPCDLMMKWQVCIQVFKGDEDPTELRSSLFEVVFRSSWRALKFPPSAFAPWGGSLSFGSDVPWYFGGGRDVPSDQFDFLSSAIHELGHVLGVGSAESWSSLVPRELFVGAQATAAHGGPVALHTDFGHWAAGTASWADGVPQGAAFTPGLAPGERKLLTELDIAALRDIGWTVDESATTMIEIDQSYVGQRIKGDVTGDGVVDHRDADRVRAHVDAQAAIRALGAESAFGFQIMIDGLDRDDVMVDSRALSAADVFPMVDGNSIGDGIIDDHDVALLRSAASLYDVDGDGLPSWDENSLNKTVWMNVIGRPRYQPLSSWTEKCFDDIPFLSNWKYMSINGWVTFIYCSRDGTPWSIAPGLAPEDSIEEFAARMPAEDFAQLEPTMGAMAPDLSREPTATDEMPAQEGGGAPLLIRARGGVSPVSAPPRPNVLEDISDLSILREDAAIARSAALGSASGSNLVEATGRVGAAATREPDAPTFAAYTREEPAPIDVALASPLLREPLSGGDAVHGAGQTAEPGAIDSYSKMRAVWADWFSGILQSLKKIADLLLSWVR
jgi:hypothetical protein